MCGIFIYDRPYRHSNEMSVQFDFFSIVTLLGIVQGLFLSVILFGMKRGVRRANRILSLLIFIISASIFIWGIVHKTALKYYLPHLIGTSLPMLFMYGPLYHFYVKALVTPVFKFRPILLLHFIPVLASVLFVLPLYLSSVEEKIRYVSAGLRGGIAQNGILFDNFMIAWLVAVVHINVYTTTAKRVLYRYNDSIRQYYSNIDMINFKWLRVFATIFSLAWYFIFAITAIDTFILKTVFLNNLIPIIVTLCFFLFGYIGMVQRDRAVDLPGPTPGRGNLQDSDVSRRIKYRKSALDREQAVKSLVIVREYMESGRPQLEADLTLPDLARRLGMQRNDLSQILNSAAGQNFYDFVNSYRVEELKRLLRDPAKKNITLLGLALEAGFNSKAAFNAAFKKHAGQTPSEYLRRRK